MLLVMALVVVAAACDPLDPDDPGPDPIPPGAATKGVWSAVLPMADQAVNAHVLPTGKVMYWPAWFGDAPARIWDPVTGESSDAPFAGYNIFCTGEVFLPDGRMFLTGGSVNSTHPWGTRNTSIFDPFTNEWTTSLPDMSAARWYPTNTLLPNGEVVVVSGEDSEGWRSGIPEVWQPGSGTYRVLSNAERWLPLYPWMYLAPNGKVFNAGPNAHTAYLDPVSGVWEPVLAVTNYGDRDVGESYGSSAMYLDGKVHISGGGNPPTATSEVIDLGAGSPTWTYTDSMASPRKQHVTTILPDGKLLAVGGSSGFGKDNAAYPVYTAEMWDPATGEWSTMASMVTYRGYHSTAFLLPDGRVMSAGAEDVGDNAEIFSPPYLFKGPRPTISSAPDAVAYGTSFPVTTPDAADVDRVTLVALSSVTHGFDMNQRFAELSFTASGGTLSVAAPSDPNLAPPGFYMLFVLDDQGVPSTARMVRIGTEGTVPPTTTTTTTVPSTTTTAPTTTTTTTAPSTTTSTTSGPLTPPAAPSGLTASAPVGTRRVDLTWIDGSTNETRFRIQRSTNGRTWSTIASVGADVTSFSNTDLTAGQRYWYRVRAYNGAGDSSPSNIVEITAR